MKGLVKMNNKGFTLIELLGVLVVLTLILLVAIPNITSTFERNKNKINEKKKEVIISAAEIYVNRYKEESWYNSFLSGSCGISIKTLKEEGLLTDDELKNSENNALYNDFEKPKVKYNNDGTYELDEEGNIGNCIPN